MKFQVRRKYRSPEARWVQKTHETTRESSGGSAPGARLPPTSCAAAAAITLPARCVGLSDETAHGGCPGQGAGGRARTRRAHCVADSGKSVVRLTIETSHLLVPTEETEDTDTPASNQSPTRGRAPRPPRKAGHDA